jgi:hypothetical protein
VKRLLLLLPIVMSASCTGSPPTVTPAPPTESTGPATPNPAAEALTLEIKNTALAVGQERIAFLLYDSTGNEISGDSYDVEVNVLRTDPTTGSESPVAGGAALYFGIPIQDGGGWVVYSDFDSSGPWSIEALVSRTDGWSGRGVAAFEVAGPTDLPRVGDRVPDTDAPRADGDDLSTVTSDPEPDPDLYQMTVNDAVETGKPTVVIFSSPEHCAGEICAATLEEVKILKGLYGSQVNFIHLESRDLADPGSLSASAQAWAIATEPWTFVVDEQGRVAARVEGPLDRTELELLVKRVLGVS